VVYTLLVYTYRSLDRSRFKIALDYFFHVHNELLHLPESLLNYSTISILMILMIKKMNLMLKGLKLTNDE
jgi:hypothetical protein